MNRDLLAFSRNVSSEHGKLDPDDFFLLVPRHIETAAKDRNVTPKDAPPPDSTSSRASRRVSAYFSVDQIDEKFVKQGVVVSVANAQVFACESGERVIKAVWAPVR